MVAKNTTWIGGAALGAVVLMAGTWFLGVSPILDETASVHERRESSMAENVMLEARLSELSAASARLPELKDELAALQVGIPSTEQVDEFLRRLDALQTTYQIAAVSVTVSDPVPVVDNQGVTTLGAVQDEAAAAAAEPADGATAAPSAEPTASAATADPAADAAAAPATAAGPAGFVAVPVEITLLGGFPNSLLFLADLQADDQRLFLVTDTHGEGQDAADASDGRPATQPGDVELKISGNLYVLSDPTAVPGDTTGEQPAGELPSFGGQAALGANG
ncbi:hypothetical protein [Cellulomonas taurus]|uniref:hypothetical protein n=1 Tax=Cellulomonas taurus TaxID=2729175 RepID=UPI00145E2E16|nr:hypothetical protein [Cellulomonas taurus]